jgi:hypothetical protein
LVQALIQVDHTNISTKDIPNDIWHKYINEVPQAHLPCPPSKVALLSSEQPQMQHVQCDQSGDRPQPDIRVVTD